MAWSREATAAHCLDIGTIHILRQQKDWAWLGGWVYKMGSCADVQYHIYANKVVGSEKVQNYADIRENRGE